MPAVLLDTNILVYAYAEGAADARTAKAREFIAAVSRAGTGCVAVQNLAEFSSFCLYKARPAVAPVQVTDWVHKLSGVLVVLRPSAQTVTLALSAVERHGMSFWDAMLWAVAKENEVTEIGTEDYQDGRLVEGVRFRNPLR